MWSLVGLILLIFFSPWPFQSLLNCVPPCSCHGHPISVLNGFHLTHVYFQVTGASYWTPVMSLSRILLVVFLILATSALANLCPAGFDQISTAFRGQKHPTVWLCPHQILLASSPGLIYSAKLELLTYTFTTRSLRVIIPESPLVLGDGSRNAFLFVPCD